MRSQGIRIGGIIGLLALLCVLFVSTTPSAQAATGDWPTYLMDNGRSGFNSSETIINPSTAPRLKLHWTHTTERTISSQPVVSNGIIYWGSWDGFEHATALNNARVWSINIGTTTSTQCVPNTVGVASTATLASVVIGGSTVSVDFVGGGNGRFYALNAATGATIWSTLLGSPPAHFIWGSPAVYNGSVYIGMASLGDCPLVQGQFIQLNAATGAIQHTFNTVPTGCTGGSVWGSPTIDASNGTLFFTTGNPGSCGSPENLSISLVEVRTSDLSLISSWRVPASEQGFDTDFGSTPTFFTATLNGISTPMVGVANKNGIYYAFRRSAISSGPVWQDRVARSGACPQCGDGSISPSAWDGSTLYVAGGSTTIGGTSCKGGVRAVNPATGAFKWEHCMMSGPVLGAVSAVPGVVVIGEGPWIIVMNATTGVTLFRYNDTNSSSSFLGAASFSNGIMYIGNNDGHLLAFGL